MDKIVNVAILASGSGSNAENILKTVKELKNIQVKTVISDIENAYVLTRAKNYGVEGICIPLSKNKSVSLKQRKQDHEQNIMDHLNNHDVNWVLLAGYMKILTPFFIDSYFDKELGINRIINIHPSLLPDYPGLDSYKRSFADNNPQHGITLHAVDSGVDTGPILIQKRFNRLPADSFESFVDKGMRNEYEAYSEFLMALNESNLHFFLGTQK